MFVFLFEISIIFFNFLYFFNYWNIIGDCFNFLWLILILVILEGLHEPNSDHFSKHLWDFRTSREITTFVKNGFFCAVVSELWMHKRYLHKSSKRHWSPSSYFYFLFEDILQSFYSFFFFHCLNFVTRRENTGLHWVFKDGSALMVHHWNLKSKLEHIARWSLHSSKRWLEHFKIYGCILNL